MTGNKKQAVVMEVEGEKQQRNSERVEQIK